MYHKNPLLAESNVKSFGRFVQKKDIPALTAIKTNIEKKLSRQRSLPGFETRGEKKLDIVKKALDRKYEIIKNQENAVKKGLRYNPLMVRIAK